MSVERVLERLNSLIDIGERVLSTRRPPSSGHIAEDSVNDALFHQWRTSSLALLNRGELKSELTVDSTVLNEPMIVINVGLELFYSSLISQGAEAVHVDWRPPAGGNEKLMALLARMKSA